MSPSPAPKAPPFRIGEGWDVHALVPGRPLVIGGVPIAHTHGLLGHSDADVLLHAITDALLGAAGLGDIGTHFPDSDAAFKGADSAVLLAEALARVQASGWRVGNVDATVVAQAPRLAPHRAAMVARIAALLRRAFPEPLGTRLVFGPYCFDAGARSLSVKGQPIELKNREYELALFLFRNMGRLLSRTHLREAVWGEVSEVPSRSLDTHISRLRGKLGLAPGSNCTITSVYGMGYRLDLPGEGR